MPAFEANPPDDLGDSNRYWERREGMRARIPASLVVDSRDVFPGTADAEVWLIRGDHPVANRTDFARRVFRDAHPLDNQPGAVRRRQRLSVHDGALRAQGVDRRHQRPARTGRPSTPSTNSLVGGVYFNFSKYQVMVEQQPRCRPGVDPSTNAPPQAFDRNRVLQHRAYNVENLYDFRDDPFDGCDFTGNPGAQA